MEAEKRNRVEFTNENEFKKLERSVKKYNMLAYKRLVFSCYSSLRVGALVGRKTKTLEDGGEIYEFVLPTDTMFAKVHGKLTLVYVYYPLDSRIILHTIHPENILGEGHRSELGTYKGVMVSKENAAKDRFKIDLLNMIKD